MQVSAVLGLLGGAIRGLLHTLLEEGDISNEQGCALIQGMVCLAKMVKQQRRSRNLQHKSDPHTFRFDTQLCFRFHIKLQIWCPNHASKPLLAKLRNNVSGCSQKRQNRMLALPLWASACFVISESAQIV